MNIRKQLMEGLILTQDDKALETVVQSLYYELFKEGFEDKDIVDFILIKVKEYLASHK
jgi:hypothetical protein